MLTRELKSYGLNDLEKVAQELIGFAGEAKLWLFIGEMGAGKTTLIKKICQLLEVQDQVSSPTFSIVNEYATAKNEVIYHFDFYRLKDIEEAYNIGVEEYFDSGCVCLMEWPQIIADLLPESFMTVHLEELLTGERSIILKHHG